MFCVKMYVLRNILGYAQIKKRKMGKNYCPSCAKVAQKFAKFTQKFAKYVFISCKP